LWSWLPDTIWLRWTVILVGFLTLVGLSRISLRDSRWVERLSYSALGIAAGFRLMSYLQLVVSYPFGLSWSEGNRFYDYSLIFGKYLYDSSSPVAPLYNEPGRYALWGVLFLIPGLPIWVHRLWNALLWTVPLFLLGVLVFRWAGSDRGRRLFLAAWAYVFMMQGPIYPSLVLSALLVAVSAGWKRLPLRSLAVFLATYYAALSRWTWLVAPATWGALLVLLWREHDPAEAAFKWLPVRKEALVEAIWLVIAGLAGGVLAKPGLFTAPQEATGFALKQPLLFYRLFPNATYAPGLLLGLAMAAGPLVLLLVWLALSRRWRLSWVQWLAAGVTAAVFAVGGLVASTKIGGGSNLHNLDSFLITLAILSGLAVKALVDKGQFAPATWPRLAQALLALTLLFPLLDALKSGAPLKSLAPQVVSQAIQTIQAETSQAQGSGEVLFMDQRQLLTFGNVEGIVLVPEYEKKFMMDQAMAGIPASFEGFYRDLAEQRFSMIVSGTLRVDIQGRSNDFSEENNAWDQWVARAILCYYKPKQTLTEIGVQLLVPRASPREGCQ
jgi:hypothetical protein